MLQPADFVAAQLFVLLQGVGDVVGGSQRFEQADGIFHGQLGAGADGVMGGCLGVA